MQKEIDVIEDDILKKYPLILEILLYDQTTKKNILWATDNYNYLGIKSHLLYLIFLIELYPLVVLPNINLYLTLLNF